MLTRAIDNDLWPTLTYGRLCDYGDDCRDRRWNLEPAVQVPAVHVNDSLVIFRDVAVNCCLWRLVRPIKEVFYP